MIEEEIVDVPVTKPSDSSNMDVDKETSVDHKVDTSADVGDTKGDYAGNNASEPDNSHGPDRSAETKPSQMDVEPPKVWV